MCADAVKGGVAGISLATNITSLGITGRLDRAGTLRARSLERLSTGIRINRACDDPAGISVSATLQANARILTRARLNLSDGLSVMQVADGALNEISNLLTRMRELSEQSANGTFSRGQRESLDGEYRSLDQEIRRITDSTSFNGIKLLTGERSGAAPVLLKEVTDQNLQAQDISADGSYAAYLDPSVSGFSLVEMATAREIRVGTELGGAVESVKLRANGDAVFLHYDGSRRNLYIYRHESGLTEKLTTNTSALGYKDFTLSADGSTIAFTSRVHYIDGGTLADGSSLGQEWLHTLNLDTGVFHSVAQTISISSLGRMSISGDGTKIALLSRSNLGENPSSLYQLFYVDMMNSSISQLSQYDGVNYCWASLAGVTNDGTVYAGTWYDLVTGASLGGACLQEFSTRTNATKILQRGVDPDLPWRLSADEKTIFEASSQNLTGSNPSGNIQYFRYDIASGVLNQLSSLSDTSNLVAFGFVPSGDGSRGLYAWEFDETGEGTTWVSRLYTVDLRPDSKGFDFEAGLGSNGNIVAKVAAVASQVRGLGAYTLTTPFMAKQALDLANRNIEALSESRGMLGAAMSRLSAAQQLIASQHDELASADTRIKDTDIAEETSRSILSAILQQSATALLASANAQPQLALRLLQGAP